MNHRYSNKRSGKRAANGRFARVTARDVIGQDFNDREQVCRDCDYHWTPQLWQHQHSRRAAASRDSGANQQV